MSRLWEIGPPYQTAEGPQRRCVSDDGASVTYTGDGEPDPEFFQMMDQLIDAVHRMEGEVDVDVSPMRPRRSTVEQDGPGGTE